MTPYSHSISFGTLTRNINTYHPPIHPSSVPGIEELALMLLCPEVAHSHSIRSLDLDYNYLDAAGKHALAQAIRTSVSLRHLSCADQRQIGGAKLSAIDKGKGNAAGHQ